MRTSPYKIQNYGCGHNMSVRVRIIGLDEDNPHHVADTAIHKGLIHKLVVRVMLVREDCLGRWPALFEMPAYRLLHVTKACAPCDCDRVLFASQGAQDHREPRAGCAAAGHRCTLRPPHTLDHCGTDFLSFRPHRHCTNCAPGQCVAPLKD